MVVAAQVGDDGIFFQHLHIVAVVVEIGIDGVVIETEHLHARFYPLGQGLVEPQEVFLLDVTVAHFHEGATVHAHNHERVDIEDEAVGAPQVVEGLARALAPSVFMIAWFVKRRMPSRRQKKSSWRRNPSFLI